MWARRGVVVKRGREWWRGEGGEHNPPPAPGSTNNSRTPGTTTPRGPQQLPHPGDHTPGTTPRGPTTLNPHKGLSARLRGGPPSREPPPLVSFSQRRPQRAAPNLGRRKRMLISPGYSDSDSDKSPAVGGNVPAKVRNVRIQKWSHGPILVINRYHKHIDRFDVLNPQ